MRLLFSPMAAMAMTMKNLLSSFRGLNTAAGATKEVQSVVTTDAQTNHRMNIGKAFSDENRPSHSRPSSPASATEPG